MRSFLVFIFLAIIFFSASGLPAAEDAIAEVNQQRARTGLFPFIRDEGLTIGAQRAADYRAARHIQFHCNDGQFLPPECQRSWTSGAGVSSNKFMACYTEYPRMMPGESMHGGISGVSGNTVYAGAAIAYDNRGQRYCHLFVSGRPSNIQPVKAMVQVTQRIIQAAVTNRVVGKVAPVQTDENADVQHRGRRRLFFHRR